MEILKALSILRHRSPALVISAYNSAYGGDAKKEQIRLLITRKRTNARNHIMP